MSKQVREIFCLLILFSKSLLQPRLGQAKARSLKLHLDHPPKGDRGPGTLAIFYYFPRPVGREDMGCQHHMQQINLLHHKTTSELCPYPASSTVMLRVGDHGAHCRTTGPPRSMHNLKVLQLLSVPRHVPWLLPKHTGLLCSSHTVILELGA